MAGVLGPSSPHWEFSLSCTATLPPCTVIYCSKMSEQQQLPEYVQHRIAVWDRIKAEVKPGEGSSPFYPSPQIARALRRQLGPGKWGQIDLIHIDVLRLLSALFCAHTHQRSPSRSLFPLETSKKLSRGRILHSILPRASRADWHRASSLRRFGSRVRSTHLLLTEKGE